MCWSREPAYKQYKNTGKIISKETIKGTNIKPKWSKTITKQKQNTNK